MSETEQKIGGKALQLWLTVLVAMLLGSLGWFSVTVIQLQNDLVRLRTQFEERGAIIEDLRKVQREVVIPRLNQQHEDDLDMRFEQKQMKEEIKQLRERKP